jgi:hypothetical protein
MILKAFCTVLGNFDYAATSHDGGDWVGHLEASEVIPNHCYQLRLSCEAQEVLHLSESVLKSSNHMEFLIQFFQNARGELEFFCFDNHGHSFKINHQSSRSEEMLDHCYLFEKDGLAVEFKIFDAQKFELNISHKNLSLNGICKRKLIAGFIPTKLAA